MPIPPGDASLDRGLLRDDVYRRLRDAIVDGTFAPGEQLKDLELAAWLGVSRTPVREALLRLAHSGLVLAQPGRSTVVSELDAGDVRDARDVVAVMHELAVREGAAKLTGADVAAMREANRRFAAALDAGDAEAALRADDELHGVLVTVSGNRALATVLEQFTPSVRRAERLRFGSLRGATSVAQHEELIRLCAAGDAEGAAKVAYDTWHSLPVVSEPPTAGAAAEPAGELDPAPAAPREPRG
ncbi:GntR family transcriptional regulator [Kineococcus sp. T13]|uniref:GntR family transcriptional regulator n=1 Tax=Kineococcus vitellinus TaxID=2696565 RepID=UPI0014129300|nr:GntR family transcriptional regulator [Kineococcus vitellinus]NAZ75401.1 GntR family transcriptional regulator [Kineococcus vitellinus]